MKRTLIFTILFLSFLNISLAQTENDFTYKEIISSVEDFDKFNETILRDKNYYQQNSSNNDFFVNGKNSVSFDRENMKIEFFFSEDSNYKSIVDTVKKNLKKKEFKLKETSNGKYYVSTYTSEKFYIEIYSGYKGNRYLTINKTKK